MDTLATDVIRELKHRELKNRILIIIISITLLFVTNFLWFIQWNNPPKEKDETEIMRLLEGNDDEDAQSENEKSE